VDQRIGITPSESFSHEPSSLLALIWFTRAERVWLASQLARKNNFLASWNKTEAAVDNYLVQPSEDKGLIFSLRR
jgi:hypothetical protein